MPERKSKVMDDTYIVIQSWMVKELGLKDKELLVYALIYGFSQDGETWFTGSMQYIGDWIGVDRKHIYIRYIKPLLDRNLLVRDTDIRNNVEFPKYKAIKSFGIDAPNLGGGVPKWDRESQNGTGGPRTVQGESQIGTGGAPKMGLNNITDNIEDNILLLKEGGNSKTFANGFNRERFVRSKVVALQIARMDEASYGSKWSNDVVDYVEDSCNCFGPNQMRIINKLTDEEYSVIFTEATALVGNDPGYSGIQNPKAFLSSVIQKQIANHKKMREGDDVKK